MSKIPIPRSLVLFTLAAVAVLSSPDAGAQSSSFSRLVESDHGGIALYFYPSTVRVIVKMIVGEDGSAAFAGIKRGRVVYGSAENAKLAAEIRQLTTAENEEGFSMLMQFTNAGTSVSVMSKEGKKPMTLLFMADGDAQYAVEIEGEITPQMMMQLMSADVGAAAAQFGIGPSATKENTEEMTDPDDIREYEELQNDTLDE